MLGEGLLLFEGALVPSYVVEQRPSEQDLLLWNADDLVVGLISLVEDPHLLNKLVEQGCKETKRKRIKLTGNDPAVERLTGELVATRGRTNLLVIRRGCSKLDHDEPEVEHDLTVSGLVRLLHEVKEGSG